MGEASGRPHLAWRVQAVTDGGGGGGGGRRWRLAAGRVTMGRLAGSSPSARPATPCCTLLASSFLCCSPFRFALTVPGNPLRPPNRLQVIGRGRGIVRGGSQDEAGRQPRSSHLLKPGRASEPDIAGWRCWMEMIKRSFYLAKRGGTARPAPQRRWRGAAGRASGNEGRLMLVGMVVVSTGECHSLFMPQNSVPAGCDGCAQNAPTLARAHGSFEPCAVMHEAHNVV